MRRFTHLPATLTLCAAAVSASPVVPTLQHGVAAQLPESSSEVRLNRTAELLGGEDSAFGIISSDRSLNNARSLARSGLDFVIIDMEHGPWSPEALRTFLLGMTDKRAIAEQIATRHTIRHLLV